MHSIHFQSGLTVVRDGHVSGIEIWCKARLCIRIGRGRMGELFLQCRGCGRLSHGYLIAGSELDLVVGCKDQLAEVTQELLLWAIVFGLCGLVWGQTFSPLVRVGTIDFAAVASSARGASRAPRPSCRTSPARPKGAICDAVDWSSILGGMMALLMAEESVRSGKGLAAGGTSCRPLSGPVSGSFPHICDGASSTLSMSHRDFGRKEFDEAAARMRV